MLLRPATATRLFPLLVIAAALGFGGCATPGANHVYLATDGNAPILDLAPPSPAVVEVASHTDPNHPLYGVAYDPFTDHLFLRLAPGHFVRVIDRPAGKIKREFFVAGLPYGRGDIAIRSSDRDLFFVHPALPAVVQLTLYGETERTITLEGLTARPAGLAYDQKRDQLLILLGGDLAHVDTYTLDGQRLGGVALDRNVRLGSLAYDSIAGEFYVPLHDEPAIGVFDRQGHFQRAVPLPAGGPRDHLDVGQRSAVRMF